MIQIQAGSVLLLNTGAILHGFLAIIISDKAFPLPKSSKSSQRTSVFEAGNSSLKPVLRDNMRLVSLSKRVDTALMGGGDKVVVVRDDDGEAGFEGGELNKHGKLWIGGVMEFWSDGGRGSEDRNGIFNKRSRS